MATSGVPFLASHWYYNTESGELTNGNNLENLGNNLVGGAGWHELNIPGTDTEAQAAAAAKQEFPGGKTPTTSITQGEENALQQETGVSVSNPLDFLQEIGDFFSRLTQANTWIRLAKILAGGLMMMVGLSHLTGADNSVANAARNIKVLPV